MRKSVFILAAALLSFRVGLADSLESLIDAQKKVNEAWLHERGDMPPVFLSGDANAVEIYSEASSGGEPSALCEPVDFDRLIELSGGAWKDRQLVLNTDIPGVRDIVARSCLMRPGDSILAIGDGWQRPVSAKSFVLRNDKALCPGDAPYSLWISFDGELPAEPLFFSTDSQLREGANVFPGGPILPTLKIDSALRTQLQASIPFFDDYEASWYNVSAKNCSALLVLRRRAVRLDDAELPNEMVLWQKGDAATVLSSVKVDARAGSGHLSIAAILDVNGDGNADVLLDGVDGQCPFRALYMGTETGFTSGGLPTKPCGC